jgi:hypothetical protein
MSFCFAIESFFIEMNDIICPMNFNVPTYGVNRTNKISPTAKSKHVAVSFDLACRMPSLVN